MTTQPVNESYRDYKLVTARTATNHRTPGAHQVQALQALYQHFGNYQKPFSGGLLVLPTGGGKTFTALRFLCRGPLSQGFKVLWLAHTHHLLEQAFVSLEREVGQISEPKERLHVRMVSGTPGHSDVADIKPQDDVIIATLQTITRAYGNNHKHLMAWLDGAGERLAVIFDEAHHAPAYSYRTLLQKLRERQPGMYLLGLTATPVYATEGQDGWLKKLFPSSIIYQTTVQKLMADGILAQPVFEEYQTNVAVQFDDREYKKWLSTYRDVPEDIVSSLAQNQERNQFIASTYVQNKDRFGKTIIFVDRWYQCEQLREMLLRRGVRADAVYSHVTLDHSGPELRNRRTSDDNHKALERFRKGEIDVLINVRMLTEGTDVPDVGTVFITRQTTSQILMTQMIGRALRGQRFGGTEKAYIVSFVDSWKHLINWAEYSLYDGETLEMEVVPVRRPPVHLISVALVQALARVIDSGLVVAVKPFRELLPLGWYQADYMARVEGTDDLEAVIQLVMVFDNERAAYEGWIASLSATELEPFADEYVQFADQRETLEAWRTQFFAETDAGFGDEPALNLFHVARHLATHEGKAPPFFVFEERDHHDLDKIAAELIDQPLSARDKAATLQAEYARNDRYWKVFYPNFMLFKSQYDACENRLLLSPQPQGPKAYEEPERYREREPSREVKDQVLLRDSFRCLSCGDTTRGKLEVDHVAPYYLGGTNSLGNLQTLCNICNGDKGISEINFRHNETTLTQVPAQLPVLNPPMVLVEDAANPEAWKRFLRRQVNFFYRCAAVADVVVSDGPEATWNIQLWADNDPQWIEPFLAPLLERVQARRVEGGATRPGMLIVDAPNKPAVSAAAAAPVAKVVSGSRAGLAIVTAAHHLLIMPAEAVPLYRPDARMFPISKAARRLTLATALIVPLGRPILAVSSVGRAYSLPPAPVETTVAEGQAFPVSDVVHLEHGEGISLLTTVPEDRRGLCAVILTSGGMIKRLSLNALMPSTVSGRSIMTGDQVAAVGYAFPDDDLIVVTYHGYAIRFRASDVPEQKASAGGVRAVRLNPGDVAVALAVTDRGSNSGDLVVVTEGSQAKRTPLADYRVQSRDGGGLHTSSIGGLIGAFLAETDDELLLLSQRGKLARVPVADVPLQGRSTAGDRLVSLESDDQLICALAIPAE